VIFAGEENEEARFSQFAGIGSAGFLEAYVLRTSELLVPLLRRRLLGVLQRIEDGWTWK
jgi:hypothetical protein